MDTKFEWDEDKARSNERKHGIGFEEASSIFADPIAVIFDDPDHSEEESREIIVGYSNRRRILIVSFTHRDSTLRISQCPSSHSTRTRQPRTESLRRINHER